MVTTDSLRKQLYELWIKNPYLTPKKACEQLHQPWLEKRNYIKKLLYEFRSYHNFGSPQEAHFPKRRVCEWDRIPRIYENEDEMPLFVWRAGWRVVRNRNDMWAYKDDRGAVHWYKEGLVRLYLKGELPLARAKELFCRAFSWFTPQELRKYLDAPLKEKYRKWTFELGAPVPRFEIRTFERSHGLRIFADGSDPRAIHVGESVPFWIDEQRQATSDLATVIQNLGVEIEEHLKLIKLWQREARVTRSMQLKPIKRKLKEKPIQKSLFDWMLG